MEQVPSTTKKKTYNYLPLAILLGILIILFATNPNESQFKEFLKEDFKKQATSQGIGILGRPVGWLAGLTTKRSDYLIFSTFEIDMLGDMCTYVGIFNHFVQTKP